jgi:hypothetical protein
VQIEIRQRNCAFIFSLSLSLSLSFSLYTVKDEEGVFEGASRSAVNVSSHWQEGVSTILNSADAIMTLTLVRVARSYIFASHRMRLQGVKD